MILASFGLVVALVMGVMVLIWRKLYRTHEISRFSQAEEDELRALLARHKFRHVVARPLFGASILWAKQKTEEAEVTVEVCRSQSTSYVRLSCVYEESLRQGMEILGARRSKQWKSVWGLVPQPVEGAPDVQGQLVFLARSQGRVREIVASPLRRRMVELNKNAEDFKLTDDELFLRWQPLPEPEQLDLWVAEAMRLCVRVVAWCKSQPALGPEGQANYQDALSQMDLSVTRLSTGVFSVVEGRAEPNVDPGAGPIPSEFKVDVNRGDGVAEQVVEEGKPTPTTSPSS